jgi:hypothetical protein
MKTLIKKELHRLADGADITVQKKNNIYTAYLEDYGFFAEYEIVLKNKRLFLMSIKSKEKFGTESPVYINEYLNIYIFTEQRKKKWCKNAN